MNDDAQPLVRRTALVLRPDPSRVVTTALIPSRDAPPTIPSRLSALLYRVLALPEEVAARTLEKTLADFAPRHRDLAAILDARFAEVTDHVADPSAISTVQRRLIGAYLSKEYAIEGASFFNPSMVRHPDQSGLAPDVTRFLMTARAVGEGHISCIEFRTGTIDGDATIRLDQPDAQTALPRRVDPIHSRPLLERLNEEVPGHLAGVDAVLATLPAAFGPADLDEAFGGWSARATFEDTTTAAARLESLTRLCYRIEFPTDTRLDARVIMPGTPAESHGLEDVRLVHMNWADGTTSYLGTYTAYDGADIAPHLLRTEDFTTFSLHPLTGPAAKNKGMALFPRTIAGLYMALSRWDREMSSLATSADMLHWEDAGILYDPRAPWEIVQTGNCGSPLETEEGWLVLTHGVGPMRTYSIGAMLLDLDDPRHVLGYLDEPLLSPVESERDGYVPNVVYSCGAMLHGSTMVLPYGADDATIRFALVDVPGLLRRLRHR